MGCFEVIEHHVAVLLQTTLIEVLCGTENWSGPRNNCIHEQLVKFITTASLTDVSYLSKSLPVLLIERFPKRNPEKTGRDQKFVISFVSFLTFGHLMIWPGTPRGHKVVGSGGGRGTTRTRACFLGSWISTQWKEKRRRGTFWITLKVTPQ